MSQSNGHNRINTKVTPLGSLEILSRREVSMLADTSRGGLHELFRRCSLAVLNCGSPTDDEAAVLDQFSDFDIQVIQQERGIKLDLVNAPDSAFVDGQMLKGIQEHLFAVLRDVLYVHNEINASGRFDGKDPEGITNAVFHILRNAQILSKQTRPNLVVCWGGHSISREEYDYTKNVGYELGLRGLNICTGCGPGAMKGPMKGATIAHAKQRSRSGRYIGITEPGIIAAESPNPIVNSLVIMPDIEKRLEAFVRAGHGFIVFPGGVGTAEEILYLLGILLNPDNADMPFPLILTGPAKAAGYFKQLDAFIRTTLGEEAASRYEIIVDDPSRVARRMRTHLTEVYRYRRQHKDALYFNWMLQIEPSFKQPFDPTHESMAALNLHQDQPRHELASNLRRAFSGIVAGNVKSEGIRSIERHGPFELHGEPGIVEPLDSMLRAFVDAGRMRLGDREYTPCYRLVS